MKIAICSSGQNWESPIDIRFGRCPYFLLVDDKTNQFEVLENTAGRAPHGAGVSAAQMVANKKVGAVLGVNFGPNAVNVLGSSGIKIYSLPPEKFSVSIAEALELYKEGKLKKIEKATGMGRGSSTGSGRDW
ncbi:MAG: NifB/NifX family molybdenum-iron cluster-binding protein [Candidatus Shapirobacteria bacterium]|nr:NifB/NifX family molybdenum-iron cluster-binding protein [Candidatus Shapirobacteria bacterium]